MPRDDDFYNLEEVVRRLASRVRLLEDAVRDLRSGNVVTPNVARHLGPVAVCTHPPDPRDTVCRACEQRAEHPLPEKK